MSSDLAKMMKLSDAFLTSILMVMSEEGESHTTVCNIKCNKCKNVLPPHTEEQHLNVDDPIHKCPRR